MIYLTFKDFLRNHSEADTPFWPGAKQTTPFALRTDQSIIDTGGSPIHTGNDRSQGKTETLFASFSGNYKHFKCGGTPGTCTTLESDEYSIALQWYHAKDIAKNKGHYRMFIVT